MSRTDSRCRLAELLELAGAQVIAFPSHRLFDRTELPHLPRFVTVTRLSDAPPALRAVLWHRKLSWVPDAQLAAAQIDRLVAINTWLFRNRDELVVPVRERSPDPRRGESP
jgi:hypothetical protein